MTSIFAEDTTAPTQQPKPQAVTLRTPHDASLVVKAIEVRTEELDKLAKKNEEAGYPRQAREQRADAGALREFVLPQFKTQQELPLATPEQVHAGIMRALRPIIHDRLVVRVMEKGNKQDQERTEDDAKEQRETALVELLAQRIERFADAVAGAAYEAGVSARESAPEVIALRAIDSLYES